MLGRQELIFSKDKISTKKLSGYYLIDKVVREDRYSEKFWKYLGAGIIDSIDNSDFGDATIICDMNEKLPTQYVGKYSAVVDLGTLEYIFNFLQAIKNTMDLCKGGT